MTTETTELEIYEEDEIFEEDEEIEAEEYEEIEAEIEVIEPMTKTEAKKLDKKIRATSDKVTSNLNTAQDNFDVLVELLAEAHVGNIYVVLDFPSWTAYIKDAVQIIPASRDERKSLVSLMSEKGMSQRAIAGVLQTSQKTVDRDLDGEEFDTDTVTSISGATVARNKKKAAKEQEAEPQEAAKPSSAADLVAEFNVEAANAHNAIAAMVEIMTEPKWPGARKRVGKAHLNNFGEWIAGLQTIIDDLMVV